MASLIPMFGGILLGCKLTKLFRIYDFSGEKDPVKVLIIIIHSIEKTLTPKKHKP